MTRLGRIVAFWDKCDTGLSQNATSSHAVKAGLTRKTVSLLPLTCHAAGGTVVALTFAKSMQGSHIHGCQEQLAWRKILQVSASPMIPTSLPFVPAGLSGHGCRARCNPLH